MTGVVFVELSGDERKTLADFVWVIGRHYVRRWGMGSVLQDFERLPEPEQVLLVRRALPTILWMDERFITPRSRRPLFETLERKSVHGAGTTTTRLWKVQAQWWGNACMEALDSDAFRPGTRIELFRIAVKLFRACNSKPGKRARQPDRKVAALFDMYSKMPRRGMCLERTAQALLRDRQSAGLEESVPPNIETVRRAVKRARRQLRPGSAAELLLSE